ncbi:uncharacterized protein DDB_G0283697 isoform X2 [Salmo trutta]|uniref:uncharacterized protein DDB_G0283697 isoform X2 n=1 Tax=Salmo trutta TaxID=8032 RepID=UPI001131964B|nr:uncharacterized protein DDB_G0283697-like isoform X2 [Salmo trutta]
MEPERYSSRWQEGEASADLEEYGASDMSYIMDPSSGDWSEGSLRGSGAPFSPDTDGDVGDPVQPSVDLELARKKKELAVIEEKIARKKAVLATRQLKLGVKDIPKKQTASTTVKGMSKQTKMNNTIFKTYNNVADRSSLVCLPLKRRVLDILSKDTPANLKKQNEMRALELMISAPLENEEAHPLRVKALMNQRRYPDNEEVVPDDKPHNPTIQRPVHSLRTQEQDKAATGFQRFLNVLNEGVDINKLSKIVNDENELPVVGEKLPQVWPTLPEGHVDSSSRSKSSPVEEKKVRLEDEQQYEQMQTLLEIVGLDLGVKELGQLTDRTNDRLYGKMGDLKRKEFKNEKGKEKKESEPSFKHLSTSSLSSDSASPSPLLNQHSNMTVEYSSSSNRVWDIERQRDRSERDWHRHSGTRDKEREREEDIVREMDRSERNRKGDGHRHSSTRERDKDIPVVRETNRSERNGEKDWDRSERDWDRSERDRDRSERDRDRSERDRDRSERDRERDGSEKHRERSERDRDRSERDRERDRSERQRDRSERHRDSEIDGDEGRETNSDRSETDRVRYRSERHRDRERCLQRDRDKHSRTRDWDSESNWDSHYSTRDWDIERSERDWYGDESRESSSELYSYSVDPIYPVSHPPHASMMATYSPTQYSQYMAYHSSPYTIAFPPGWGYPHGTMLPGTMLPGIMLPNTMPPGIMPASAISPGNKPLLPNPPGDSPYPSSPPYYSNGTTALNQTYAYTQPASNLQLTSTQPATSNLQLSSTQPATSNLQLTSSQPATSNLQLTSTQPATSNLQLTSTQLATSNLQLTSSQPATSNLQLTSTQPATSNLQLTSTQHASNHKEKTQKHAEAVVKVSCQMATKKSPAVLTTRTATKSPPLNQGPRRKQRRNNIFFTGIFRVITVI